MQRLTAAAEHLSDSAPFDAYLLAPATYNSINKIAAGVADGVVTSAAASALGRLERGPRAAVLVAPTMHGSLHNRILVESLQRLHALGVRVVPPRDAYGKHNLPDERGAGRRGGRAPSAARPSAAGVSWSPGARRPVPIDGVRRIVNRFRGRLGIAVAAELHLRGAETLLVHGDGAFPVPSFIPHRVARTYDDYRAIVARGARPRLRGRRLLRRRRRLPPRRRRRRARSPAGRRSSPSRWCPRSKIIEEVRQGHPDLYMVTFKYQEGARPRGC